MPNQQMQAIENGAPFSTPDLSRCVQEKMKLRHRVIPAFGIAVVAIAVGWLVSDRIFGCVAAERAKARRLATHEKLQTEECERSLASLYDGLTCRGFNPATVHLLDWSNVTDLAKVDPSITNYHCPAGGKYSFHYIVDTNSSAGGVVFARCLIHGGPGGTQQPDAGD